MISENGVDPTLQGREDGRRAGPTAPAAEGGEVPNTGLDLAMSLVGDRWTLLVVDALLEGPRRFSDLQEAIPGLAPNVLTARSSPGGERAPQEVRWKGRAIAPAARRSKHVGSARPASASPTGSTTTSTGSEAAAPAEGSLRSASKSRSAHHGHLHDLERLGEATFFEPSEARSFAEPST